MWDAIVVGARCAGATTAMLLARQGHRVLMVDRAEFPSDTMSTLFIHQPGVALLEKWDLLGSVAASGCPPIRTVNYQVNDVRLTGPMPAYDGVDVAYAPRRRILDQMLVDAAVAAGVEFAVGCSLVEILTGDDGRVTGVCLRARSGATVTESTRLVIGADGMGSRTAELVGAPTVVEDPRLTCIYYSGWTGISQGYSMVERQGSWTATVPTHSGVTLVLTYFPQDLFASIKFDPLAAHRDQVRTLSPELHEQMSAGEQAVKLTGTGNQRNYFRQSHGPGWALVGDAGHHLDSITALGITNAFVQADLIAQELGGGDFADQRHVDSALSRFAERRDSALTQGYRRTLVTAQLKAQDSREQMLRAISGSPEHTERYFALAAGILSMDEFLSPELVDLLYP